MRPPRSLQCDSTLFLIYINDINRDRNGKQANSTDSKSIRE